MRWRPATRIVLWAVGVGSVLRPAPARAQDAPDEGEDAAALFERGVDLLEAGRIAEACPLLARSHAQEPTWGSAFDLARCAQMDGHPAEAWERFREAAAIAHAAGAADREQQARLAGESLSPRLGTVVVALAEDDAPGLEVTWDGRPLDPGRRGSPFVAEVGEHVLITRADGAEVWSDVVVVSPRSRTVVSVPPPRATSSVAAASVAPPPASPPESMAGDDQANDGATQRDAGLGLGTVGLLGLGLGMGAGIHAFRRNDESLDFCEPDDPTACAPEGITLRQEALTSARVATGALVLGGAALVAGIVVYFTAPSAPTDPDHATAALRLRPGDVSLTGRF